MEWYHIWEGKRRKHIKDLHEDGKENKDNEACHIYHKIKEFEISQKVKTFLKILTKFINKKAELRMIRYRECPKYKEKTLVEMIKTILDECVVDKNINAKEISNHKGLTGTQP
ncbi:hypothetical protein RCL_jg24654.t1 [Rhizophagus clarus]|uniref:Uncharacterized protein n=1 Tax=Rhizophagus clarus TaxID=94130 RepID=A0A8H3QZK0_9GLOM|nr:hypothetical protein RCL_jg24654.t1 [Rhizophagus clarus]